MTAAAHRARQWRPVGLINWLAIGSLVLVISRILLLDVPEPIWGLARTGEILNNLALAYLAAWIFHLIVIERPRVAARRRVAAAYRDDFLEVAGKGGLLLEAVARKKLKSAPPNPTLEEVTALCASVNRGSRAPYYHFRGKLTSETLDWIEYFDRHLASARDAQERLSPALPFLEPETIAMLRSVNNSDFEKFIKNCVDHGLIADTLRGMAPALYSYVQECNQLSDHLKRALGRSLSERRP